MGDYQVLVLDSVLNRVDSIFVVDFEEAQKNAPGRFSTVPWAQTSVPSGERATVEGGPADGFVLAFWDPLRPFGSPPVYNGPINTGLPIITGVVQVGQTLMATSGIWLRNPTSFTYQWVDSVTGNITGATTSNYLPTAANIGHTLSVIVVASNPNGQSAPVNSAPTSPVVDVVPTNIGVPVITGTAQVGQALTASTGTWLHAPTSFTYQWIDTTTGAIPGATASAYVPVAANVGHTLTVSVVATNSGGPSVQASSLVTSAVIDIIPTNTAVPTITGTAQVNQTLTASPGTWTHNPTSYAYQWTDTTTGAIGGATASTYVPVVGNIGHTLTVSVVATNSGGSSAAATSNPTSAVIASSALTGVLDFSDPANSGLLAALGLA
jgi:hypothetical protein